MSVNSSDLPLISPESYSGASGIASSDRLPPSVSSRMSASASAAATARRPSFNSIKNPLTDYDGVLRSHLAGANGVAGFSLGCFRPFRLPLVVKFFSFCDRDFTFYPAVLQVKFRRNDRETLLSYRRVELFDFPPMQQQFSLPYGAMVEPISVAVLADVCVQQPRFVVFD